MNKSDMPPSIRRFVEEQNTCPVSGLSRVRKSSLRSPFGSFWYRAAACAMLSGRVQPKRFSDGSPNMVDVNRFGKEANFNQYLFERVALTLATMDIVVPARFGGPYEEGPNIEAFWKHDEKKLSEISRQAVLKYLDGHARHLPKRATPPSRAHLIEFLTLFFACFQERAIVEPRFAAVLQGFSRLPEEDLVRLADHLDIKAAAVKPDTWSYWVELKDATVLRKALATTEWMNGEERDRVLWVYPGSVGLWALGLDEPMAPDELPDTLKTGPKGAILAGLGRSRQALVPLFRHCTVQKINDVCEFRLDPRRMAQEPSGASPGEALRQALEDLRPFPLEIAKLLGTESKLGGEIIVRGCRALVQVDDQDMLEKIRKHPKLKNYIEPGAPPGYLLIKPNSDAYNFMERCRSLGFTVTTQGSIPFDTRMTWLPIRGSR